MKFVVVKDLPEITQRKLYYFDADRRYHDQLYDGVVSAISPEEAATLIENSIKECDRDEYVKYTYSITIVGIDIEPSREDPFITTDWNHG